MIRNIGAEFIKCSLENFNITTIDISYRGTVTHQGFLGLMASKMARMDILEFRDINGPALMPKYGAIG